MKILRKWRKIAVSLCRADPQSFRWPPVIKGALAFHRAFVIRDSFPDRSLFYLNDALDEYRIATTVNPNVTWRAPRDSREYWQLRVTFSRLSIFLPRLSAWERILNRTPSFTACC